LSSLPHSPAFQGDKIGFVRSSVARNPATTKSGSRFKFIGETIAELKKVVWLTRRQVIYLTALVLALTISAGIVLGAVDYGFTRLMNAILGSG
jgi:preprotein translocase subunit SecE